MLEKIMKERELTPNQLAKMAGVSRQTLAKALKGDLVSDATKHDVAEALDIPIDKLFPAEDGQDEVDLEELGIKLVDGAEDPLLKGNKIIPKAHYCRPYFDDVKYPDGYTIRPGSSMFVGTGISSDSFAGCQTVLVSPLDELCVDNLITSQPRLLDIDGEFVVQLFCHASGKDLSISKVNDIFVELTPVK